MATVPRRLSLLPRACAIRMVAYPQITFDRMPAAGV